MPRGQIKECCCKVCKQCGKDFKGARNSKYCSLNCLQMKQYEANMLRPEWRLSKLVAMAKNRAKEKDLPFDIDADYMYKLWKENYGRCSISNIPLELGRSEKGKVHPYAPSIDRIVPSLGYTKGNVRIICYQANVAISEFGLKQLEEFMELYRQNKMGVS